MPSLEVTIPVADWTDEEREALATTLIAELKDVECLKHGSATYLTFEFREFGIAHQMSIIPHACCEAYEDQVSLILVRRFSPTMPTRVFPDGD